MSDWETISTYTRKQALEDGVLVDVTEQAREVGFKWPLAVTSQVFDLLLGEGLEADGQSFAGRALDLFVILRLEIRRGSGGDTVYFSPLFVTERGKAPVPVDLWARVTPEGENGAPVITVMFTDED